ncbi:MAG TPA: hypothetical protein DCE07_01665 [Peptococcaceae bacterium]|nr:hypothetical protein [Peptococcaceae bacterium]
MAPGGSKDVQRVGGFVLEGRAFPAEALLRLLSLINPKTVWCEKLYHKNKNKSTPLKVYF